MDEAGPNENTRGGFVSGLVIMLAPLRLPLTIGLGSRHVSSISARTSITRFVGFHHQQQPLTKMPSYIVTVKDDATPEQLQAAKQHAKDQGGTIGHEYTLIKGFSVSFPEDSAHSLDKNEHVKAVELDQEMRTQ